MDALIYIRSMPNVNTLAKHQDHTSNAFLDIFWILQGQPTCTFKVCNVCTAKEDWNAWRRRKYTISEREYLWNKRITGSIIIQKTLKRKVTLIFGSLLLYSQSGTYEFRSVRPSIHYTFSLKPLIFFWNLEWIWGSKMEDNIVFGFLIKILIFDFLGLKGQKWAQNGPFSIIFKFLSLLLAENVLKCAP